MTRCRHCRRTIDRERSWLRLERAGAGSVDRDYCDVVCLAADLDLGEIPGN